MEMGMVYSQDGMGKDPTRDDYISYLIDLAHGGADMARRAGVPKLAKKFAEAEKMAQSLHGEDR